MKTLDLESIPDGRFDIVQFLQPNEYDAMLTHIENGSLPADTLLRLDSLGDKTPNPEDARSRSLRWDLILQLAEVGDKPEKLTPLARRIIYGGELKAVISWDPEADAERLHTEFDPPFLIRKDLAEVIRERRVLEGKTITEVPDDKRWRPPEHVEFMQCYRLSHRLWGVMARRIAPEFVAEDTLDQFYRPTKRSTSEGVYIDEGSDQAVVKRGIISAIAFNIRHIRAIYDEARTTGVTGIGPTGRQDLHTLLADEYPELHEPS